MDSQKLVPEQEGILTCLELLSRDGLGVRHIGFECLLREFGNITVSDWHKVVKFTSEQLGFWDAEMLFAPAASPIRLPRQKSLAGR